MSPPIGPHFPDIPLMDWEALGAPTQTESLTDVQIHNLFRNLRSLESEAQAPNLGGWNPLLDDEKQPSSTPQFSLAVPASSPARNGNSAPQRLWDPSRLDQVIAKLQNKYSLGLQAISTSSQQAWDPSRLDQVIVGLQKKYSLSPQAISASSQQAQTFRADRVDLTQSPKPSGPLSSIESLSSDEEEAPPLPICPVPIKNFPPIPRVETYPIQPPQPTRPYAPPQFPLMGPFPSMQPALPPLPPLPSYPVAYPPYAQPGFAQPFSWANQIYQPLPPPPMPSTVTITNHMPVAQTYQIPFPRAPYYYPS